MRIGHCFIAFNNYFATGEGVTSWIALGSSHEHAERVFRANVPPYFQRDITVLRLTEPEVEDGRKMRRFVPDAIIELIQQNPPGTTEYSSRLHYNLS